MSGYGYGFGYNLWQWGQAITSYIKSKFFIYKERVEADGGVVQDENLLRQYYNQLPAQDSIEFAWFGEAGSIIRDDGVYDTFAKIYDLSSNNNDGTQTTESLQPSESGNIAPNENIGMKNANGDNNYITHPEISFAVNEAWSLTIVLNWNADVGSGSSNSSINWGGDTEGIIALKRSGINRFTIYYNASSAYIIGEIGGTNVLIGKNSMVSFVYDTIQLKIYINGVYFESLIGSYPMKFISTAWSPNPMPGTISSRIIRSAALTPTEVLTEAQLLQTLYPPIPNVLIGAKNYATSNLDIAATCQGNIITEVQDTATWATSQTLYDNAISGGATEHEALQAAAMWCYYNNDTQIGSVYNKLYNGFARNLIKADIITQADWGYHITTEAEWTTLIANSPASLKKEGTGYWNTALGNNTTGLTVLGGAGREADGSFGTLKNYVAFWCGDSDKVVKIYDDGTPSEIVAASLITGAYIRLTKD